MISFIIIVTILVFNTVLILFLKRNNILFSLQDWILIVSVIATLIGLMFVLWQDGEINNEIEKRNWKTIEGEIIESKIVGNRALRTEVKYQYKINDAIYYGNSDYNIPGFGSKNYRRKTARIIKTQNPVGSVVKVYYDPVNPENSTLRYGPYWSNYMIIGFGSVLFLIGMFASEWWLLKKYFNNKGEVNV